MAGEATSESLKSLADWGTQLLLLQGVRAPRRPPDRSHPFGYGRAMYFYSFIVALLLFFGGGVFSIYEGIHKLEPPDTVEDTGVALITLVVSIALEGWSTVGNVRAMNRRRGDTGFVRYLRATKDSD